MDDGYDVAVSYQVVFPYDLGAQMQIRPLQAEVGGTCRPSISGIPYNEHTQAHKA